jgi:hypothetical protein
MSPKSNSALPVAKETAAKTMGEGRWAEYVRLSCVEIAAVRAATAQAAMSADQVIAVAKDLARFVTEGR